MNFFPNKHGVSKYFSPCIIIHKENLEYGRHCNYHIGEYLQAHDEIDHMNANAPHPLDCMYLRPMDNAQVGQYFVHLQTNKVVKRCKFKKNPSHQV